MTGLDGRFDLTVDGSGNYLFRITTSQGSYVEYERAVSDQDHVELTFDAPSGALSGRVAAMDRRPLENVGISLALSEGSVASTTSREYYRSILTANDGSFIFELLDAGVYTLRAPDGRQGDPHSTHMPYGRIVVGGLLVGASKTEDVELFLPGESWILGDVIDALGAPVIGALISVLDERESCLAGRGAETRTDATGHFQIENVAPGNYVVRACWGEHETVSSSLQVEADAIVSIRIQAK